jgi:Fe-S oxidoreductase
VNEERPLIGLEPSCLLSFRDEYPDLLGEQAKVLAPHCLLIDEFLVREAKAGRLLPEQIAGGGFMHTPQCVILHGHCHQLALAKTETIEEMLRLFLPNIEIIRAPAGCCGMAGAFGYEKRHYKLSQQIGAQRLFPLVNSAEPDVLIVAAGTSCRQQITQGTGKDVLHPVEVIWKILSVKNPSYRI